MKAPLSTEVPVPAVSAANPGIGGGAMRIVRIVSRISASQAVVILVEVFVTPAMFGGGGSSEPFYFGTTSSERKAKDTP